MSVLLRKRFGSVAVGFAFVVALCGLPLVMSLYLQQVPQLSPFETGRIGRRHRRAGRPKLVAEDVAA